MRATAIALPFMLIASGCARSMDAVPPSAARAPQAQPVPSTRRSTTATSAAPDDDPIAGRGQGIRVGEPSPYDRSGPRNPAPGTGWHAFGNEPFWSVQARGGTLVFATPDNQRGVTLIGRRVPSLVGTVILGAGPRGNFHFGVTPGKCSDGMSDRSFAYTSTFIYDGITYKGCAEPVEAR